MSENLGKSKLSRIRDHTDKYLDKIIFDSPEIFFFLSGYGGKLTNIEISEGQYKQTYSISGKKYNQLIIPMYRLQADVEIRGEFGFINGLIKPSIEDDSSSKIYLSSPSLHFYFEDYANQKVYEGRTSTLEESVLNAIMRVWNKNEFENFSRQHLKDIKLTLPEWFEVQIDTNKTYLDVDNIVQGVFRY
jgi:hypothetical protein